ncbi:hypothetical protein NQD34_008241 [Periophthalmus magnuspinnatus]|nr:hypothetical protein NQD34_008241 [Periophthalmus magnuspinnatus]
MCMRCCRWSETLGDTERTKHPRLQTQHHQQTSRDEASVQTAPQADAPPAHNHRGHRGAGERDERRQRGPWPPGRLLRGLPPVHLPPGPPHVPHTGPHVP